MIILVGASASGKTELSNLLIKKYNMKRMVTYTTRKMRINEIDKVSYNFVSEEEFKKLIDNDEFVESVIYNGNYYGTRKSDVSFEKIVILEPKGFLKFKEKMPNEIVSFYLNVDEDIRIERMRLRKDKEEDIMKRIKDDREVFGNDFVNSIDFVIDNNNIVLDDLADKIYKMYEERKKWKF